MSALLVLLAAVLVPLVLYLWKPRRVERIVESVTTITQAFWIGIITVAAIIGIWTGVLFYMISGAVVIAIVTVVVVSETDLLDRSDIPFL
jgi:predicted permease